MTIDTSLKSRPMTKPRSITKAYARDLAGRVTALWLASGTAPVQSTSCSSFGMVLSVTSSPGRACALAWKDELTRSVSRLKVREEPLPR